jgi:predicted permease
MSEVIALVLPFFGLIFAGFVAALVTRQPLEALGWMNTFIVYLALPALFFQLVVKTPVEQLTEWSYIFGAVASTYIVFGLMFAGSMLLSGGNIAESTVKGLASAYGNIGYMGPGLALLAFGEDAAVPVALIFCFENIVHFTLTPTLMALSGQGERSGSIVLDVVKKIVLHPFIMATVLCVIGAYFTFRPPEAVDHLLDYLARAAAPCALFAMGVTLALRPLNRVPHELALIAGLKLIVHPLLCYVVLSWIGNFSPTWTF